MTSDLHRLAAVRARLRAGLVIPAHPLALTARRRLDERRQQGLTRYYLDAGAGGLAVGVHTTQFAIRDPKIALYAPVLTLAMETAATWRGRGAASVMIAGVVGKTGQALREARLAADLGYDAALVSVAALRDHGNAQLLTHLRAIADIIPVMGFYLQPAVGGRPLDYRFWRAFAEIERVVAIKIAPFNRYETLDVIRGVRDAGRADDVALYTGNDDNIIADLVTPWPLGETASRPTFVAGGLLGHWAVWTHRAVKYHAECRRVARRGRSAPASLLALGAQITDANGALFDVANRFRGCIPGIHEILRRQGLLAGRWCLDPREELSPGQAREIDRICRQYPHLTDDDFVREHLDRWLA